MLIIYKEVYKEEEKEEQGVFGIYMPNKYSVIYFKSESMALLLISSL
jgi:hypothetical protein